MLWMQSSPVSFVACKDTFRRNSLRESEMFHKIPVGFSKWGLWLIGFPGFGILQPRPQGFSLSKLEGRFFLREKLWGRRRLLRALNKIWNCNYFLNGDQRLQWLFRDMLCSRKLICLIVKNSSAFSSTLSLSRCDHATLFLSKVCHRVSINECEQALGGRGCISRLNAGSRRWGDPWDPCKTVFKS